MTWTIDAPGDYDGAAAGEQVEIRITASGVTLRNPGVRNSPEAGIRLDGVTDVTILNPKVYDWNRSGIAQHGAAVAMWRCGSVSVSGFDFRKPIGPGNGIWGKADALNHLRGCTLKDGYISGAWDGIGSEIEDNPLGGFKDTLIEGVTVEDYQDDGIQTEGRNENVTVRRCVTRRGLIGYAMAPSIVGPLTIEDCEAHDFTSAAFKMGDGGGGKVNIRRFKGVGQGDGLKQTNSGLGYQIHFVDSCLQVGRYVYEFSSPLIAGGLFDRNRLSTTDATRFAKIANNNDYRTLAALQAIGMDLNSVAGPCEVVPVPPTPPPAKTCQARYRWRLAGETTWHYTTRTYQPIDCAQDALTFI